MTLDWSAKYVGIPWQDTGRSTVSCDCWGLVCIVYRQEHGIDLPSYEGCYSKATDHERVAPLYLDRHAEPWHAVLPGQEQSFDVLVFRLGRYASHVGLWVRPGRMLHCADGLESVVEPYFTERWERRLIGTYRHRALL